MAGAATTSAIIGRQFGQLIAIMEGKEEGKKPSRVLCICDCGDEIVVNRSSLYAKYRAVRSCHKCGVAKVHAANKKHGWAGTRIYHIWSGMKQRCLDVKNKDYSRYGGRGVKICDEWMDVTKFAAWLMANGYNEEMTIDRIDMDGSYEPTNCRLLTFSENSSLTRNTHWLEAFGEKKTIAQWLKDPRCKAKSGTLYSRWKYSGWSAEDAITTSPNEEPISGEKYGRRSYLSLNV